MIKYLYTLALMFGATVLPLKAAVDFHEADSLFANAEYGKAKEMLEALEPSSDMEKVEQLWRLSRVCLLLGEESKVTDQKRSHYAAGISFAERGRTIDPGSVNCHMWHSANVGRDCQTRDVMKQAAAVPVMMEDLTNILEKIGADDCSEAWQALGEIYFNHPFKSTDAAINFARRALDCLPEGELRLSTYAFLAKMLLKRGRSAEGRKSEIKNGIPALRKEKTNIGKRTYYASSLGADHVPAWAEKPLGEMSDKEEAGAIIDYATDLYKKAAKHFPTDDKDYKELENYIRVVPRYAGSPEKLRFAHPSHRFAAGPSRSRGHGRPRFFRANPASAWSGQLVYDFL